MEEKKELVTENSEVVITYKDAKAFPFHQDIKLKLDVNSDTEIYVFLDLFVEFLIKMGYEKEAVYLLFGIDDESIYKKYYISNEDRQLIDHDKVNNSSNNLDIDFDLKNKDQYEIETLLSDKKWMTDILYKINSNEDFAKNLIKVYIKYLYSNKNN